MLLSFLRVCFLVSFCAFVFFFFLLAHVWEFRVLVSIGHQSQTTRVDEIVCSFVCLFVCLFVVCVVVFISLCLSEFLGPVFVDFEIVRKSSTYTLSSGLFPLFIYV